MFRCIENLLNQTFFVLVFAVVLSRFYPKILKEEIGKSVIMLKLVAIILKIMQYINSCIILRLLC